MLSTGLHVEIVPKSTLVRLAGCSRIDEHKAAVKHARTEESAVAEDVWVSKYQVDFQGARGSQSPPTTGPRVLAHQETLHF